MAEQNGKAFPFAFLLNIGSIPQSGAVEIVPGYTLRRANSDEIACIKTVFNKIAGGDQYDLDYRREISHPLTVSPFGTVERLLPNEWRYFVVAFEHDTGVMTELIRIFTFSEVEPEVGFTVTHYGPQGEGY